MFCNRLNLILKLFIILSLVLGGSMIWYCLLQDNSSITQTKKEITYLDTRLQYFSDYYSTEYCDENFTVVLIEYVYNT